jgi:hypothetical protein
MANSRKQTTLAQKSKTSLNSQIPDIEYDGPDLDNDDYNLSSPELHPETEMQIKEEEQPVKKKPGQNARVGFNSMEANSNYKSLFKTV